MKPARLRLSHVAMARRDARGPESLSPEHDRVVEFDQLGALGEFEFGNGERQSSTAEQGRREPLPPKTAQLLDDARDGAVRQIQATIEVGIVVTAFALEHARKPERPVRVRRPRAVVPREAAVEDHANVSERSALIARISSSARPVRTRSIGRRSPSRGLTPNSHASAASGSYSRNRFDQASSSRSTFSALRGSMPAPRSQRVTCERLTPSRSATRAADRKSTRSAWTFWTVATGMSVPYRNKDRCATLFVATGESTPNRRARWRVALALTSAPRLGSSDIGAQSRLRNADVTLDKLPGRGPRSGGA